MADAPPSGGPRRLLGPVWLSHLVLALVYFGVAKFGLLMAIAHPSVSLVWPASGIALAALLLWGSCMWPGILLGAFLADLTTPLETPAIALGIALGNTAEALVAACLIRWFLDGSIHLERPVLVGKFAAIAALSSLLAASIGTLILCTGGSARFSEFWPLFGTWWLGDAAGILIMTPLLLSWSESRLSTIQSPSLELVILWVVLLTFSQIVFSGWVPTGLLHYPIAYLILLPLLWIGLLNRIRVTTAALVFIMAITVWGTYSGFGPFAGWSRLETSLQLQLFLMASALVALAAGAYSSEKQLKETVYLNREAMLRTMVDEASDAVLIKSLDGRCLLANRAAERIMGRPYTDIVGIRDEDVLDTETLQSVREIDRSVVSSGMPKEGEIEFAVGNQRRIYSVIKYPFLDRDGVIRGITGIYHDITEHKQIEEAMQRGYALLQALQETTIDGILVVDEQQRVVSMNRRFQELWGIPAEMLETRRDNVLLNFAIASIADPEAFLEKIRFLYEHPTESSRDMIVLKDGRTFDRYTAPALSPAGEYFGRVWFFRDITDSKQLEEALKVQNQQLQQLDYLKDLFLSSISHEMKTPLSLITGYAELLEDKYPDEELVAGILDGSWRLSEHLTKILDYSALLSSSMPLYLTEVCLKESACLVQDVITANADFRAKQLNFQLEIQPDTPPVNGDSRRISQIMLELLENSVKFTPTGGTIGIRIAPMEGSVRIEVWDTGIGIPPAALQKLGQAFTHMEQIPTLRTGGLGLGLSIVKKLVKLHDGSMKILSQPGQGTTVVVLLPRQANLVCK